MGNEKNRYLNRVLISLLMFCVAGEFEMCNLPIQY